MTLDELQALEGGFFIPTETDHRGAPIDWGEYDAITMYWVHKLRTWVNSPCKLIRGDHNIGSDIPYLATKATAIDAWFPKSPYSLVMVEVMRLPCSWGLYVGKSVHLDTRNTEKPARWLAFKPSHVTMLKAAGLGGLMGPPKNGWVYMRWSDVLGVKALYLLQQVADNIEGDLWKPGMQY